MLLMAFTRKTFAPYVFAILICMVKTTRKNTASRKRAAKDVGTIALVIASLYVITVLFYLFLFVGVIILVGPFFSESSNLFVSIPIGTAFLLLALGLSFLFGRVQDNKWKLTWPSFFGG